jgi:hypothetical protein
MTVMIGIDPHKRSHTAVALDEHDAVLDQLRLDADVRQIARRGVTDLLAGLEQLAGEQPAEPVGVLDGPDPLRPTLGPPEHRHRTRGGIVGRGRALPAQPRWATGDEQGPPRRREGAVHMPTSAGRVYIHRKLGEGKTRAEATRSLKRHLSNVVYRALQADLAAHEVSGEDSQAA